MGTFLPLSKSESPRKARPLTHLSSSKPITLSTLILSVHANIQLREEKGLHSRRSCRYLRVVWPWEKCDAHQMISHPASIKLHCKPHYSHSPSLANRYVQSSIRNLRDSIWLLGSNARSRSSSNKLNRGILLGLALLVALSLDYRDPSSGAQTLILCWSSQKNHFVP